METVVKTKTKKPSELISKAVDVSIEVRRENYSWENFSVSLTPIALIENSKGERGGQFIYNKDNNAADLIWNDDQGYHKPMLFKNICAGKWRITYKSGSFCAIIFSEEFYIGETNRQILCSYESRTFFQV
jgi:hypothetical protein